MENDATLQKGFALPKAIAVSDAPENPLAQRRYSEPPHPYRTDFVRDGARILHAKAFRRLAGKTQVFTRLTGLAARGAENDHSRSRLTHTLEVAQIARTTAATLGLNSALAEVLALVHDIGHPPFGHAGEKALDTCLRQHGLSFDHNLHALRIVTSFEERYAAFRGLNLTLAVREGIIKHSRDYSASNHPELREYFLDQRPPLEAQLIDLADEIAYLTADIEDGLAANILSLDSLETDVPLFSRFFTVAKQTYPTATPTLQTNEALKQMLNALVTDFMHETVSRTRAAGAETLENIRNSPHRLAHLSQPMEDSRQQAKRFLYAHLYQSTALAAEHHHADEVIQTLFAAWTSNPELLPPDHQTRVHREGAPRAVADYIAGMTDSYIESAWIHHIRE